MSTPNDYFPSDLAIGVEPKHPVEGTIWFKPVHGDFTIGVLTYVYSKEKWHITYDVNDANAMIEILAMFGEVKITKSNNKDYFCCHMPRDHGALWYYESKATLNEALDKLIQRAIKLNVIQ